MADIISTKMRASFDVDVDIIFDLHNAQMNMIDYKDKYDVLLNFLTNKSVICCSLVSVFAD